MLRANVMRGQTLLEVIVAFSVAIILVAAIASAVLFSLSNAQYGKTQNLATQYTQEGMEIVRKLRDSGSLEVLDDTERSYCLPKDRFPEHLDELTPKTLIGCPEEEKIDKIFVRTITIEGGVPKCGDGTQVTSSVTWSDSKCKDVNNLNCHKASLESCLSGFSTVSPPGVNPTIFSTPTSTPIPAPPCCDE